MISLTADLHPETGAAARQGRSVQAKRAQALQAERLKPRILTTLPLRTEWTHAELKRAVGATSLGVFDLALGELTAEGLMHSAQRPGGRHTYRAIAPREDWRSPAGLTPAHHEVLHLLPSGHHTTGAALATLLNAEREQVDRLTEDLYHAGLLDVRAVGNMVILKRAAP